MSDFGFEKSEYFDDGVRFGTGPEMIAEIKSIRSELEEARHRIAELETSLSAQTRITDAGHRSQKEMLERIASLEAALKLIKDFPITHPQENQDAANMAEIARSTLEGKDNA